MSESSIPPPFRAELIGSLVRPQAIKDARNSFDEGNISEADLKRIEDSEIKKIISLQEDLGFQVVSDGELRRSTYSESFTTHGITGLELMDDAGGAWTYKNDKGSTVGQRSPPGSLTKLDGQAQRTLIIFSLLRPMQKRLCQK